MLTILEVSKLAKAELIRQRKAEQEKYLTCSDESAVIVTDRLKKLDKDISLMRHMIDILERAEQNKLKYKSITTTTTTQD